jgi:hypothetical protein
MVWIEIIKTLFAAIAAAAAGYGAHLALRNWRLGVENTRIANTNAENAARWKRAELASSYLAPLFTDDELIFALRCIDWGTGRIPIPERHRPMFKDQAITIDHKPELLARAMIPRLQDDVRASEQAMLYRLALDALFTRFEWIGYRVSSGLIHIEDVPDLGYWMELLATWRYAPPPPREASVFLPFLRATGYDQTLRLITAFGFDTEPAPASDKQSPDPAGADAR